MKSEEPCYLLSTKNFEKLKSILECYSVDGDYIETTRQCEWITNGVTEETFYEFDGDSSDAKKGLAILDRLTQQFDREDPDPPPDDDDEGETIYSLQMRVMRAKAELLENKVARLKSS